jgi:hypothetical protein
MALESTQRLIEMITRNIFWEKRRPVSGAENLTTFMCRFSWNLGASISQGRTSECSFLITVFLYVLIQRNLCTRQFKFDSDSVLHMAPRILGNI